MEDFCNAIHKEILKQFRNGELPLLSDLKLNVSHGLGSISQACSRAKGRFGSCVGGRRVSLARRPC